MSKKFEADDEIEFEEELEPIKPQEIMTDPDMVRVGDGLYLSKDRTALWLVTSNKPEIHVPAGVTHIVDYAFFWVRKTVESVELPMGTQMIGTRAFYSCKKLARVNFPASLREINFETFGGCSSLKSVVLPEGLRTVAMCAFATCTSLKSVSLPKGLIEIEDYAFSDCPQLEKVEFPDSLKRIGPGAFMACERLVSIMLPAQVETVGWSTAFGFDQPGQGLGSSHALKKIRVAPGNKSLRQDSQGMIMDSQGKRVVYVPKDADTIRVPSGVEEIGEAAFMACRGLMTVTFPDTLARIGDFAFYNCISLNDVWLPASIRWIGQSAFQIAVRIGGDAPQSDAGTAAKARNTDDFFGLEPPDGPEGPNA